MRKKLMRSSVFRFFAVLACVSVGFWFALFLYVNVYNSPSHIVAFGLVPLFEPFASHSVANRNSQLATLKKEIRLLHLDEPDLRKLQTDDLLNETHPIALECAAFQSARFPDFPACGEKLTWMKQMWESDLCYRRLGVEGDTCTVMDYLSTVERVCPPRPSRDYIDTARVAPDLVSSEWTPTEAFHLRDFRTVQAILRPPRSRRPTLKWITERIRGNWPIWQEAARLTCAELDHESPPPSRTMCGERRLRVHVHIGSLTRVSGTRIAETAGRGGPLGELVQWSDLLAALIVLGHNVSITTELDEFNEMVRATPRWNSPCQDGQFGIHLLYTDIGGLVQLRQYVLKGWFDKWKCICRVLDTFGTEPKFNDFAYATQHSLATTWGRWNMHVKQFYTMFPHTPDNSFMGFVIASDELTVDEIVKTEQELSGQLDNRDNQSVTTKVLRVHDARKDYLSAEAESNITNSNNTIDAKSRSPGLHLPRRDGVMALVYGKTLDIWQGRESYLRVFNDYLVLHATVSGDADDVRRVVPSYVLNHGLVSTDELEHLYSTASMFVGLGFPYEGPSPLEAIAHGCVFINPRFEQAVNRDNAQFFAGKPTTRKLPSQHPYMETYVGEPYVYTVDAGNENELRNVIERILTSERPKPYVPFEFTPLGFLERLVFHHSRPSLCPLRNDYCKTTLRNALTYVDWPPASCVNTYLGPASLSCNEVCELQGRVCEPSYMLLSNFEQVLDNFGIDCLSVSRAEEIGYPALQLIKSVDSRLLQYARNESSRIFAHCLLQNNDRLFSCADSLPDMHRVCPCRTFRSVRKQTAMC